MSIAEHIDHTNLKPFATEIDIIKLCQEAKEYKFRAVCVNPCWINLVNYQLINSDVKIVTVVGFPLGANCTFTKMNEVVPAISHGANEIDMVWNLGFFKGGKYLTVVEEITKIVDLAYHSGVLVKVIVETCYLNADEIIKAHQIVKDGGAEYIKTSTGFGLEGARPVDIETWKKLGGLKIKASGGIKTYQQATDFIGIGADILGTSSGVSIVKEESGLKPKPVGFIGLDEKDLDGDKHAY